MNPGVIIADRAMCSRITTSARPMARQTSIVERTNRPTEPMQATTTSAPTVHGLIATHRPIAANAAMPAARQRPRDSSMRPIAAT